MYETRFQILAVEVLENVIVRVCAARFQTFAVDVRVRFNVLVDDTEMFEEPPTVAVVVLEKEIVLEETADIFG